ncbi:sugar ABC transporter substrate-binding protein (plasmid) [Agrobacterium tumefaciens]|jgi:ribose transport system substrate-binding protein|uniref:sugar ABC transporter substrate-binding protein n=2 Tax=Agrobacterium tumefaciens TaxID=358 RepID=UPI001F38A442|nr:sugar ABC transporter substrate-binding protein [Agrobacterium tumefaciens]WCA72789.1 sugar ABC transporter substrate-binding protein [Agrobacterium tumefaciens]
MTSALLAKAVTPQEASHDYHFGGGNDMILKKLAGLGLTAILLATISTAAIAQEDTSKKLYLGVGNTSAEYWTQMIWGATQVMKSVGGDVKVISNDFDPQKSLQNIGAIVAPGCEGCIFTWFPDSPAFTKTFVERIGDAGGFITTLWNRAEEIHPWDTAAEAWVANISFDGVDAGYQNGMAMCKAIDGEGAIVVLKGVPDNAPAKQRSMGLAKAIAECPGMTVLDEQVANWQQAAAQDIMRTWLTKYGDKIKGVFGQNDAMALGAVAALREAGLVGKIPVTGTDGSSDVVKLIESGEILSTMSGLNEYQGAVAAALAYGARVGDIKLADLSEAQRDFFVQEILITKENASDFLARKPDPADYTYEKIKADFWAKSAGQIPAGVN